MRLFYTQAAGRFVGVDYHSPNKINEEVRKGMSVLFRSLKLSTQVKAWYSDTQAAGRGYRHRLLLAGENQRGGAEREVGIIPAPELRTPSKSAESSGMSQIYIYSKLVIACNCKTTELQAMENSTGRSFLLFCKRGIVKEV